MLNTAFLNLKLIKLTLLLIYKYRIQEALDSRLGFFIDWISRSFYHCRKEIQFERSEEYSKNSRDEILRKHCGDLFVKN